MAVAHYLEALEWQRDVIRVHAVLGGKNPHPQTYLVGGMAAAVDPNSPNVINPERIAFMQERITTMREFVEQVYVPDVKAVASLLPRVVGARRRAQELPGLRRASSSGNRDRRRQASGSTAGSSSAATSPRSSRVDQAKITEAIAHSYYDVRRRRPGRAPPVRRRDASPKYTGPHAAVRRCLDVGADKYSWLKSPRYDGMPMEVGPAGADARRLRRRQPAGPGARQRRARPSSSCQPAALFSTLGRVAARALETVYLLDLMDEWLDRARQQHGSPATCGSTTAPSGTRPPGRRRPQGWGFHEAPRGALGHWVKIKDGKIENYQAVVPSTWNAGPRDEKGVTGPVRGVARSTRPVADPEQPLELLRTDPLVRPVPRLRGPRRGCDRQGAGARGGAVRWPPASTRPGRVAGSAERPPPVASRRGRATSRDRLRPDLRLGGARPPHPLADRASRSSS